MRDGLPPFRAAVEAGVQSVMTAHVQVPALDEAPATLSRAVVTGLLREELGYDGLVLADALEMKAVSATFGVARGAVLALAAGVDAVLLGHDLGVEADAAVQSALVDAVADGELAEERLREAAARVARVGGVGEVGRPPAARSTARPAEPSRGKRSRLRATSRSNRPRSSSSCGHVPTSPPAKRRTPSARRSPSGCRARRRVVYDEGTADPARALALRGDRPLVVVVRDAHRHAWMRDVAERLAAGLGARRGRAAALAPGRARGYVATFGGGRVSYEALADRLLERERGAGVTSRLELELHEQPEALRRLLERQAQNAQELGELFRRPDVNYVLIASRGSSSNAARYAQYLLGRANRVPVAFATPSLYTLYGQPPRLDGALVIGISQSGESPDVRAVIDEARRQGRPTIALTNRPESPIARAAEFVLPLEAGEELAVAATKTFVNSLGAIALLFAAATGDARAASELELMPDRIAAQIALSSEDAAALEQLAEITGGTVVARGINYGTSFEVALKIRELSGLLFEAWSAADLMHGPVAALAPGWPVLALAPSGPALGSMMDAIRGLADRGARLVTIADREDVRAGSVAPMRLVPGVPEWLSPLTTVIPGQLAAVRLAAAEGQRPRPPARPLEDHADALSIRSPPRHRNCCGKVRDVHGDLGAHARAGGVPLRRRERPQLRTCASTRPSRRRPARSRPGSTRC